MFNHGLPTEDRTWSLDGRAMRDKPLTLHTCPDCFAIWSVGMACPECGVVSEAKDRPPITISAGVKLQPFTPEEAEKNFYLKQVEKCRTQGHRPGAAAFRFKEKFGKWPPWAWSEETKKQFTTDAQWIENHDAKEARKARFAASPTMPAPPDPFTGFDPNDEIPFALCERRETET